MKRIAISLLLCLFCGCTFQKKETITIQGDIKSIESISFSPDGTMIAAGGGNRVSNHGAVEFWNFRTMTRVKALSSDNNIVRVSFFNRTQDEILLGDQKGEISAVSLSEADTHAEKRIIIDSDDKIYNSQNAFALSPNDQALAESRSQLNRIILSLWEEPSFITLPSRGGTFLYFSFSRDSSLLASIYSEEKNSIGNVEIYDSEKGNLLYTIPSTNPEIVLFSPKEDILFILDKGTVKSWKYPSNQLQDEFSIDKNWSIDSASLSPNGDLLAVGISQVKYGISLKGRVELWDLREGKRLCTFGGIEDSFSVNEQIIFSQDSNIIATTEGGEIKIFFISDCLRSNQTTTIGGSVQK